MPPEVRFKGKEPWITSRSEDDPITAGDVFARLGGEHVERMLRVLSLSYRAPMQWHLGHADFVSEQCDISAEEARIVAQDLLNLGYIKEKTYRITDDGLEILKAMGDSYVT